MKTMHTLLVYVICAVLISGFMGCRRERPAERMARVMNEARYALATTIVPLSALESMKAMRLFAVSYRTKPSWWDSFFASHRTTRIRFSDLAPLHKAVVLIDADMDELSRITTDLAHFGIFDENYRSITRRIEQLQEMRNELKAEPSYQQEEAALQNLEAQDDLRATIAGASATIASTIHANNRREAAAVKIMPRRGSRTTVIVD